MLSQRFSLYRLFVISPIVDHQFDSLEDDVDSNKSRLQTSIDVLTHLVVLVILSYLFYRIFEHMLKRRYEDEKWKTIYLHGYGTVVFVGLR